MTTIIGIKTEDRQNNALKLQEVLTKNGCFIKTRLGLNIEEDFTCSTKGLILLEVPNAENALELIEEISKIKGIEIKQMKF